MTRLSPIELSNLTALRRDLHRHPEISRQEAATAARIAAELRDLGVGTVIEGLGGHGVAGIIDGAAPGPTVLLRCELDALPIAETGTAPWRSTIPGKGHLCGHDGHMVTMLGAARLLLRDRPEHGRVVLMFQPAEEDGSGAIAVCDDPRFADIAPAWAFALHNEPDIPRGIAHIPDGLASAASVGLHIGLSGIEAHACAPETGTSPGPAIASLMTALPALSSGLFPQTDYRLVTLTHAAMGAPAFGIAPGQGSLYVTCRTTSDASLPTLVAEVRSEAEGTATAHKLTCQITEHDAFFAGINAPRAAQILRDAARAAGLDAVRGLPLRASEDFGRFGHDCPSAMMLLGAGPGPALHNPDYDFDDTLIAPGAQTLLNAVHAVTAEHARRALP